MTLGRGAIVLVDLGRTTGHEQRGVRPCVVVSDPSVIGSQRFPLVCVVPVTSAVNQGILYPPLPPRTGGLAKQSFALIDQLRSIDKQRILRVFGVVASREMATIDEALAAFLGLGERPRGAGATPVQ